MMAQALSEDADVSEHLLNEQRMFQTCRHRIIPPYITLVEQPDCYESPKEDVRE